MPFQFVTVIQMIQKGLHIGVRVNILFFFGSLEEQDWFNYLPGRPVSTPAILQSTVVQVQVIAVPAFEIHGKN